MRLAATADGQQEAELAADHIEQAAHHRPYAVSSTTRPSLPKASGATRGGHCALVFDPFDLCNCVDQTPAVNMP